MTVARPVSLAGAIFLSGAAWVSLAGLIVAGGCTLQGTSLDDIDGDGVPAALDCDDEDPERLFPQEEVCNNGVDDDCVPTPGCRLVEGEAADLSIPTGDGAPTSLAIADLDEDGFADIVVATGGDSPQLRVIGGGPAPVSARVADLPVEIRSTGGPWVKAGYLNGPTLVIGVRGGVTLLRLQGLPDDDRSLADQQVGILEATPDGATFTGPEAVAIGIPFLGPSGVGAAACDDPGDIVATTLLDGGYYTQVWSGSDPTAAPVRINPGDATSFNVDALAAGDVDGDGCVDLVGRTDTYAAPTMTNVTTLYTPFDAHPERLLDCEFPCWFTYTDHYVVPLDVPAPTLAFVAASGWSVATDEIGETGTDPFSAPLVVLTESEGEDVGFLPLLGEEAHTTFTAPEQFRTWAGGEPCRSLPSASGDFDGDGLTDVVVACGSTLAVWYGEVGERLDLGSAPILLEGGTIGAAVGDVDGDGQDDIVWATENAVKVYRGAAE